MHSKFAEGTTASIFAVWSESIPLWHATPPPYCPASGMRAQRIDTLRVHAFYDCGNTATAKGDCPGLEVGQRPSRIQTPNTVSDTHSRLHTGMGMRPGQRATRSKPTHHYLGKVRTREPLGNKPHKYQLTLVLTVFLPVILALCPPSSPATTLTN